ncbi:MAG: cobalt ECF transporter T component CbiQ [Nitrospirae bacterium]|nr:cobalt ECF transporter T component CbiQ [Nitrospirota bacterium]
MQLFSEGIQTEHGLSGIDARVKLVFALILLGLVLSYKGFIFPVIVLSGCLAGCMHIRVPLKIFLLRFSEPLFIIIMLVLLKFFFSGSDVMFLIKVSGISITGHADGLKEGLTIACRILGAVSVLALLGFSTPFTALMSALSWLRVPKGFVEILMFAYRYIFVIFEDAQVIYNAQRNRLGYAGLRRGLGSFGTLAGSLVLKAFDRSHAITVSMIQRGYDGDMPMLKHKPFRAWEVSGAVVIVSLMGVAWKLL